ncbi:MAG TPA: AraC family transcriptional regulator [Alphaproteobacteria bacterium]|nr:AraC family transcriptional regulator [Alphaproteobacteria bacterium]
MNPLVDVLRTLHLSGGIFLDCEFTAPWCVTASAIGPEEVGLLAMPFPAHVIAYHYVTHGQALLQMANQQPVAINAGEVVVFPANDKHRLGSDLNVEAINAKELVIPPANGSLARIVHGGGGQRAHIMCGFLGTDAPNDPLIAILPNVLRLDVTKAGSVDWIESSLRFAAREMAAGRTGSPALLAQLAECLFMEAVRRYVEQAPAVQSGWLAGFGDPVVGRALALLHLRGDHAWSVEELAAEVGLSRSAFADRFTRLMGEPPMRYLGKQRLRFAAQRLRTSHEPVARIAVEAGYESEAAFNRAFKRELGLPPAAWRARVANGPSRSH